MASEIKSEIEKAAEFIRRLGPARAEAVRLLAEAADGAGVWMHNLTNDAKALVRHEDTLTRLITEGWTHIKPLLLEPDDVPSSPAPDVAPPAAADAASPPETVEEPATVSEATPAPSQEPTEAPESDSTTDPPAKVKKGSV